MKKVELENMLMDPEGLKKLAERATSIRQRHGELGETHGEPGIKIRSVEPLSQNMRPTPDEISENDLDYIVRSSLIGSITLYIPEIAQVDPKRALKILTNKTRKDFSDSNCTSLEGAINRLLSQVLLDDESQKLVSEAIQALESDGKPEKNKEVKK